MQRYIPTTTPIANEMGFLSPIGEQTIKECRKIFFESAGNITIDKDAHIITLQGIVKVSDIQQGTKVPSVFLPHIKFESNEELTHTVFSSNINLSNMKNSSDNAHNLLCLLGVLSHAQEFKDEVWFNTIFPDVCRDSGDIIFFSDEQAAIKFVYMCQTLGFSSKYSLIPLTDIQLSTILDSLVLSVATVPSELRDIHNTDIDPLPKYLDILPDSLVYSWICGRFQSTLIPSTKIIDELSIDDKTRSFNILLPRLWSYTQECKDYTKRIMNRMKVGVKDEANRLSLSDHTYPVLLWIAIAMPFMFNRHARYLWSEAILMRRFLRPYLVVEKIESTKTQCCLLGALKQFNLGTETLPCYSIFQI